MLWEIIGDLPVVPDNQKFLAKFCSGTFRITNPKRLMSLFFQLLLEHLLEFVLKSFAQIVLLTVNADYYTPQADSNNRNRKWSIKHRDAYQSTHK